MLSDRTSIVMAQEVHLTQAQGQALLGLLRLNYPIDGDYAAGVPGAGRFRPREETAGVLTLWHTAMWKRLDGTAGNMGPSCAHPKGRILTSHLESLVDQSELHCTNAYAPQAGRGPSDAEEFGKGLLAIARIYVGLAPHVIGMDANGSVPGHEIGTPNEKWLAELMAVSDEAGGCYRRAGKPRPTHYSLRGYSKEGSAGWRAAVYHAVVTAKKRGTASRGVGHARTSTVRRIPILQLRLVSTARRYVHTGTLSHFAWLRGISTHGFGRRVQARGGR